MTMKTDITLSPDVSLKTAMRELDKTAEKVLLVVDEEGKLLGTLTDGDIRRFILQGHNLDHDIAKAYNPSPDIVWQDNIDMEKIREVFLRRKIELLPVVDKNRKVVDYVIWEDAFGEGSKVVKPKRQIDIPVVIMAGGKGTRLAPFTNILPKPLIPIGNRPVIELIIERFRAHGIQHYYLSINHMARIIQAYFEERSPDYEMHIFQEQKPLGTAGSLKLLQDKLNTPFFVSNCDIVIDTDYADLYTFHRKMHNDITMVASLKHYHIPYGICEVDNGGVLKSIIEKPEYSFLVNTGLYVLNADVLTFIPDDQLYHITQLMDDVRDNGGKVGVFPISEESWMDVGEWKEYKQVVEKLRG